MQTLIQDIRYALRQLRRAPGFVATAVLTLALGIGATTAIFTLVYQVILRSIPVSHPEQLYKIGKDIECCNYSGTQDHWGIFSDDLYRYFRDQTKGIDSIAAVEAGTITVSEHGVDDSGGGNSSATQPLDIRFVSGSYFPLLGVTPYAGRLLNPDDDNQGAATAAVISYTIWQTKFGADSHLVGRTVMMTGHPVTIVGITAANFLGERNTPDPAGVWLPLAFEPTFEPDRQLLKYPQDHWLDVLVHIRDSKQVPQVQAALQGELHQWFKAHPEDFVGTPAKDMASQTTELVSASGGINNLRDQYESSLHLLLWVVGFVLLIACANLANLMMVRGMARQQELAVRSALGAPRGRLIRQTLVEAMLLAIFGGALALVFAYAGTHAIIALALPGTEVNPLSASPSLPVLGFALLLSLITGVLFGMAPALITSRSNPVEALRGANRSTRDASALPQKLMVILQASLSLALLSTAGLLITSLRHLEHQDFRFEPQGRLLLFIDLQAAGYKYDRLAALYQQFDDKFAHLPGVQTFAYATYAPMSDNNWGGGVFFPGKTDSPNQGASYAAISPHFFDAVGTHILTGRGFNEHDSAASMHVAVVNQTFVNKYLAGKQPIGEHFGPDRHMTSEFQIVGVAEDTKYTNPSEPVRPMYFTPMAQLTIRPDDESNKGEEFKHYASNIIIRYQGDQSAVSASVRQTLKSIDPDIPIDRMSSYADQLSRSFTQEELVVRLTTLFGLLALILAAIGLYGVTAYAVARRTSEIGIRMALGASRESVLTMVLKTALTQALIGLAIGLPLAYAGGRLVQSTLYQTNAFQPLVLLAVILLLLLAATAAALIPARRAASIDPMQALRIE
jgi:predicted permease